MSQESTKKSEKIDGYTTDIDEVRDRVLNKSLVYFSIIAPLALGLSLLRILEHGWQPIYFFHCVIVTTFITTTLFRKRIAYITKATILISLLFTVGVIGTIFFGLAGGGPPILLALTIFSALIFGVRAGIIFCFVDVLFIVLVGYLVSFGHLQFAVDLKDYATSITGWLAMTIVFIIYAPFLVVVFGQVQKDLEGYLRVWQETESNLQAVIRAMAEGVVVHKNDGSILSANPAAQKILGLTIDQMQGRHPIDPAWQLTRPDGSPLPGDEIPSEITRNTGKPCSDVALTVVRGNGERAWLSVSTDPIFIDETSETLGVVATFTDVTSKKEAEEALKKSENFLNQAQEIANVGSWLWHLNTNEIVWTQNLCRMHGLEPEEFDGKYETALSFIYEDDLDRVQQLISQLLEDKKPIRFEYRIVTKAGEVKTVRTAQQMTLNKTGKITQMMGTLQDITEQKQLEDQLRQIQKIDAVGKLAGGIAHDFNNMLGGIMGAAELLEPHIKDDDRALRLRKLIVDSAEHAASLTESLLSFSRKQPLESTVVHVHKSIEETVALLRTTIDRRINISMNLASAKDEVLTDIAQLQNAFLNLGVNASHAMPEGGDLSFTSNLTFLDEAYCQASPFDLKEGEYIEINVRDSGEGIEAENLERVFEPFFTTKEQGKGTGLGLAAVFGVIRQSRGAITAYSEIGKGTNFQILLPINTAPAVEESIVNNEIINGTGCILVVDDEPAMRSTAEAILQQLGYEVILAEDGQAAIELFKEKHEKINLVLLDMVMPNMNGKDCFFAIKEIDPAVRVILSSGFSQQDDVAILQAAGLKGFIRKPYRTAGLSQLIAQALS